MMKILYLVTEDWFFASHFLPMARAAREAGLEVVVAARVRNHAGELSGEGLRVVPLDIERKSLGVLEGLRNIVLTYRIVRAERPDIVHCIALRPIVLGGLAARLAGARALVLAPTGLGQLDRAWSGGSRYALRHSLHDWLPARTAHSFRVREPRRPARVRARSGGPRSDDRGWGGR